MALTEADLARMLVAVGLLLACAHGTGKLLARFHQPRVVGEILGGFLLGPTALGAIAPEAQGELIPTTGPVASVLGALAQLGLIWLMFEAGRELRALPGGRERTAAIRIAAAGMILPFTVGVAAFTALQPTELAGPAEDIVALGLVFATALAVTSIPVISRIMMDLGLLHTPFARIVLGAAVIEDIALFGVLGIAVGLVQAPGESFGLAPLIGIPPGSPTSALYHGAGVAVALAGAMAISSRNTGPSSLLTRACQEMTAQILFVLATVAALLFIGLPPLLGGLAAGLALSDSERSEPAEGLRKPGLGFFVPLYFAIVGFQLDLQVLQPAFFGAFFVLACATKAGGVYLGARLASVDPAGAKNLAAAMNARGGPAIVLATVTLGAGIIDEGFYATLVLLAILSSLLAGWWLERGLARREGDLTFMLGWDEPVGTRKASGP